MCAFFSFYAFLFFSFLCLPACPAPRDRRRRPITGNAPSSLPSQAKVNVRFMLCRVALTDLPSCPAAARVRAACMHARLHHASLSSRSLGEKRHFADGGTHAALQIELGRVSEQEVARLGRPVRA